jgi:MFS family permease
MCNALIICLSGVNFGYALTAVSVVNFAQLMDVYDIRISTPAAHAILIGIMPVGGIFGAAFSKIFLKSSSRKHSVYIMLGILWVGLGLMLVHNMYTIIVGRFIEGIAIGLYVSVSPIYLQEITPLELRPRMMTMFGLGKALGCVSANALQNIFLAVGWDNASVVLLIFNGYLAIIQAVLYFFVLPHSPLEMIVNGKEKEAREVILEIYKAEYLEAVFHELTEDYKASLGEVSNVTETAKLSMQTMEEVREGQLNRAYWMGIHICMLRQLIGGNCLITFSGQIIREFNAGLATQMALILNCIQFGADLFSVIFITGRFGRRRILIVGTLGMSIASIIIAMAEAGHLETVILIFMSIFMALYGANILTVAWGYPS